MPAGIVPTVPGMMMLVPVVVLVGMSVMVSVGVPVVAMRVMPPVAPVVPAPIRQGVGCDAETADSDGDGK